MIPMINTAKAVIAPYLVGIKVGLLLACLAVSAFLGYRYGASTHATGEAQKSVQIVQLAAENAALRQANLNNKKAMAEANRIVDENQKKAADAQKEALTQGQLVSEANSKIEALKRTNLQRAKVEKCVEQMRMEVCAAVPLP